MNNTKLIRQLSDEGLALFRRSMSCDEVEERKMFNIGDVVMARFSVDGEMYLAEIVRKCKENVYRVIYLDYGNYENVHVKDIESVQKDELDKVDVEGASTLLDMCDFDMKTGEKIEGGSLTTGGGSNSGGGGGSGRSHKRTVAPMIIRENQERSETIHGKVALCVLTGKYFEIYTVIGRNVTRVKKIKAPGGGIKATASRRGGQSALRFARIAQSNRERWVKRVCETLNDLKDELCDIPVYLCGGTDLKLLFRSISPKHLHHTVRCIISENDISSTKTSSLSKLKDDSGKKIFSMLSDHEVVSVLKAAMR